jgi:Glu-tRNA(Gln) amidotransferase subunit E-like FAD-binding protein
MYKWLLIPPDPTSIDDVHYTNEKLEELMSGYKENQQMAAKMFEERKRDMMETGTNTFIKPGDENSKYYTKPDESPISHPAEVLERLQKEKPDAPMEELIKEADAIVAKEIEERKKKREAEEEEVNSTEAQIKEDGEVEKGEEVESK